MNLANNGANISDIGAFELQTPAETPSLVVTTAADVLDAFDGVTSLRDAIAFANSDGDFSEITFASDLIGATILLDRGSLVLSSNVSIAGDIDGDGVGDITLDGNRADRVITVSSGAAQLDGLRITGGDALYGGGLLVESGADLAVTGSVVQGNRASVGGGFLVEDDASLTLSDSVVQNNRGQYIYYGSLPRGGGIATYGDTSLTNVTVANNTSYFGGGIYSAGTTTLVNTTLAGNRGQIKAGGIMVEDGSVELVNTTITGNNAGSRTLLSSSSGPITGGGAFVTESGELSMINSIITGNRRVTSEVNEINNVFGEYTSTSSLVGVDPATVFANVVNGAGQLSDGDGLFRVVELLADASNLALDAGVDVTAPATDAKGGRGSTCRACPTMVTTSPTLARPNSRGRSKRARWSSPSPRTFLIPSTARHRCARRWCSPIPNQASASSRSTASHLTFKLTR